MFFLVLAREDMNKEEGTRGVELLSGYRNYMDMGVLGLGPCFDCLVYRRAGSRAFLLHSI